MEKKKILYKHTQFFELFPLANEEDTKLMYDCIYNAMEEYASTRSEWVSVEDMLPEEQGHYLVATPKSFPKNYRGVIAEFYKDVECFYCEYSDDPITDVTHWMAIQEPPKKIK